jgi:hypothetical protein
LFLCALAPLGQSDFWARGNQLMARDGVIQPIQLRLSPSAALSLSRHRGAGHRCEKRREGRDAYRLALRSPSSLEICVVCAPANARSSSLVPSPQQPAVFSSSLLLRAEMVISTI